MKKLFLFLTVMAVLAAAKPVFAFSVAYEQKISVNGSPVGTFNVLMKDGKMRAETKMGAMSSVMIRNDKAVYQYFPERNMAMSLPHELEKSNLSKDLANYSDFLKQNSAKVVGSETIDGKECDIYQFTDPNGQGETKAWFWKEKQFPVKIEVEGPQGKLLVELVNVNFNPQADDSQFELPAGVQMMGNPMAAADAGHPASE